MPDAAASTSLRCVRLGPSDAPALLALAERVGWEPTLDDWRFFGTAGRLHGHLTPAGRIVSSAVLLDYGPALASVGQVIVDPDWQGHGLGRAIMDACHDDLPRPGTPITLIATRDGERLYGRIGYRTVGRVHKCFAEVPVDPGSAAPPDGGVLSALRPPGLEAVARYDAAAFGADRPGVLPARLRQSLGGLVARDRAGGIAGYGLRVPQRRLLVVGPIVAADPAVALALIVRLAAGWDGIARLDVFERHAGLYADLRARGFREVDRPPVMLRGGAGLPGDRGRLFCIGSQSLG